MWAGDESEVAVFLRQRGERAGLGVEHLGLTRAPDPRARHVVVDRRRLRGVARAFDSEWSTLPAIELLSVQVSRRLSPMNECTLVPPS
jgi:hypothetical protein